MKLYVVDFIRAVPIDMERLLKDNKKNHLLDFSPASKYLDESKGEILEDLVISGTPLNIEGGSPSASGYDFNEFDNNLEMYVKAIKEQTGTTYNDDTVFLVGGPRGDSSGGGHVFPVVPFTIKKNRNHTGNFKKVRNRVYGYDFDSEDVKPINLKNGNIKGTGFIKNDDLILVNAPKIYGGYNGTFNPEDHGGFHENTACNRLKGYIDFSTYKGSDFITRDNDIIRFSNEDMDMKTIRIKSNMARGDSCFTMFAYVMMGYKQSK